MRKLLPLAFVAAVAIGGAAAYGAGKASITLDQPLPVHYTDSVSFTYTGENTETGSIQLQCFQDGAIVFSDARMTFPEGYGYGEPFTLGPSIAWTGGPAECVARLGYRQNTGQGRWRELASTTFPVEG